MSICFCSVSLGLPEWSFEADVKILSQLSATSSMEPDPRKHRAAADVFPAASSLLPSCKQRDSAEDWVVSARPSRAPLVKITLDPVRSVQKMTANPSFQCLRLILAMKSSKSRLAIAATMDKYDLSLFCRKKIA
jgi:hypothetical protein